MKYHCSMMIIIAFWAWNDINIYLKSNIFIENYPFSNLIWRSVLCVSVCVCLCVCLYVCGGECFAPICAHVSRRHVHSVISTFLLLDSFRVIKLPEEEVKSGGLAQVWCPDLSNLERNLKAKVGSCIAMEAEILKLDISMRKSFRTQVVRSTLRIRVKMWKVTRPDGDFQFRPKSWVLILFMNSIPFVS